MGIYSNSNIRWILISGFLYSIASSIFWFTPTWMIYTLGGTNTDLGYYLGVSTLGSVGASVLSSVIADYYRKDVLIWFGALLSTAGMYGMATSQSLSQLFVFIIASAFGSAIIMPAIGALFTNSAQADARNRLFGTQFMLNTGSGVIANMMNFFIFMDIGNEIADIDINLLRLSLYVGTAFSGLALLVSFRLRDSKSLTAEEEGSVASEFENVTIQTNWKSSFAPNAFKVIGISVLSAMVISFGAGTSVPYFPRFFFDVYRLDLSDLSLAFAVLTVITALWGKFTANLGDRYSRVKIIFVNQFMAVVLLYFLATYPPIGIAISVLFVRNAVMNAAGPLNNAVIMEFTPRRYRSMTFSLMQISWSFTFGLGQIFGGRLVDAVGFRVPFSITASLYLIASLIYLWIERYDRPSKNQG